jgi:multiple sugar transport system permease protein
LCCFIPKFLVLNQLGIYNSYAGLILPLIADATGVFIMKQFFESVPPDVAGAAKVDGASVFRTYWSVVLPMAAFQGSWNEFPHTVVAVQSPVLFVILQRYFVRGANEGATKG